LREPGFSLSCALNTYLYAVARNIWRDRMRGRRFNVEFKDTLHDFEDPTEAETNTKRLFEERHNTVKQLLQQLSESCRQIIMAFYYEKKSMRDIGEAMNLAEDGVRVQKHRCMGYLKTKMETHPDFPHLKNEQS
jgi:RNA polymerase sigma factor (sigma-70 family)